MTTPRPIATAIAAVMLLIVGTSCSHRDREVQNDGCSPCMPAHSREARAAALRSGTGTDRSVVITYTCPMHPEINQPAPGNCPKCGMALVRK